MDSVVGTHSCLATFTQNNYFEIHSCCSILLIVYPSFFCRVVLHWQVASDMAVEFFFFFFNIGG